MTARLVIFGLLVAAACGPVTDLGLAPGPDPVVVTRGVGPPNANPSACYGLETSPAVIETVTDQIMVQPPQIDSAGRVLEPGVFITETRQRIVEERRETWFETPCQIEAGDPEFIASLQRALTARGYYRGAITGVLDGRTRRAVQNYQLEAQGLDSPALSLAAARAMGLSVWDPELAAGASGG